MKKIAILILVMFITGCNDHSTSRIKNIENKEISNTIPEISYGKSEGKIPECYEKKLKILISNSIHDTTLKFRNSIANDTSVLIICDTSQINYKLENILLKSKYLPNHELKGYYSFLTCINTVKGLKEIGFFYVKTETAEAWEIMRFRVENYKINGLICLPGVVKHYIPPQEYDSLKTIPEEL